MPFTARICPSASVLHKMLLTVSICPPTRKQHF